METQLNSALSSPQTKIRRRRQVSPLDSPIKTGEAIALGLVATFGMMTIDQLAAALGCHREDASKRLRVLRHYELVSFCKAIRKQPPGVSKPANPFHIYSITKRGAVRVLHDQSMHGGQPTQVKDWKGQHVTRLGLFHDLKTVDCLIGLWRASLAVADQYQIVSMTPDFVLNPLARKEQSSIKEMVGKEEFIIPDALAILENRSTHRAMNLFLEFDNDSVHILASDPKRGSVIGKMSKWNAYLRRPRTRHTESGDIDQLLYVTEKPGRLDVIIAKTKEAFQPTDSIWSKVRFATLEQAKSAFLSPVWRRLDGTSWSPVKVTL